VTKVSICMLSFGIAVCVAHAPALAQYRPDLSFPPNFQPGPGGAPTGAFGPRGPVLTRPNIPGIGAGVFGSENGPGSFSPIPSEPRMSDVVNGGNPWAPRPGTGPPPSPPAPPPIPPHVIEMLNTQPVIPSPPLVVAPWPPVAARPAPVTAPSRLHWEWLAGIFGVILLLVLYDCFARKQTAR
jgi:hypothetical protein